MSGASAPEPPAGLPPPGTVPAAIMSRGPDRLATAPTRTRAVPKARRIRRRRVLILWTKWLLPLCAVLLLGSIAIWPELDRARDAGRVAFRRTFGLDPDAARLTDPRYRGVDARGRPYTITADSGQQVGTALAGNDRINLVEPRGDSTLENGGWVYVRAKDGVFSQRLGQLDLSHDVIMYRDDGTTLSSETATMDTKSGTISTDTRTHAEGPFGVLDAQGYTLLDKGAVVQFTGPARLVLNGDRK